MAVGSLGTGQSEEQVHTPLQWMSGHPTPGGQTCLEESLQIANMVRDTHGQAANWLNWQNGTKPREMMPRSRLFSSSRVAFMPLRCLSSEWQATHAG